MQDQLQQRKTQLASHMVLLLDLLKLPATASVLRRQAHLNSKPDITADMTRINQKYQQQQAQVKMSQYWSQYLRKLIRQGKEQEALEMLENEVPKYVEDIAPLCMLFAESGDSKTEDLQHLIQKFLMPGYHIPKKRDQMWRFDNQIWFLEALGQSILVIDQLATCRIIQNDTEAHHKKLHDDIILCVAVNCQQKFATGDKKGKCKVWNKQLQCLYELTKQSSPLNCLYFQQNLLASFDNTGMIYVTPEVRSTPTQRNSLAHSKLSTVAYCHVKQLLCKGVLLGAANPDKKGRIDLIDIQARKVSVKLHLDEKVYRLELSPCQKIVLTNLSTNMIHAYSTKKFELLFKISGYVQEQSLMQMAIGGHQNEFLAVTSEEGCVVLYSMKKKEQVGKIKGSSGLPINCVRWMGNNLYFGCDGGRIQRWVLVQSIKTDSQPQKKQEKMLPQEA